MAVFILPKYESLRSHRAKMVGSRGANIQTSGKSLNDSQTEGRQTKERQSFYLRLLRRTLR